MGEQRDGEAKEKTARFFPSLDFFISEEALCLPWGPSQRQARSGSGAVCAWNLNTLGNIFIQETGYLPQIGWFQIYLTRDKCIFLVYFLWFCSGLQRDFHCASSSAFPLLHMKCGGSYQSPESFTQQHCLGLLWDVCQIQVEAGLMLLSSKLFSTQPCCGSVGFRSWLEPCALSGLSQQQPKQLIFSKDAAWKTIAPSIFMAVFLLYFSLRSQASFCAISLPWMLSNSLHAEAITFSNCRSYKPRKFASLGLSVSKSKLTCSLPSIVLHGTFHLMGRLQIPDL